MNSLINYFINGGPLMWPILLCSVISWAIIVERAIRLSRRRLIDEDLVHAVRASLGKGDLDGAQATAKKNPVLVAAIIHKGIEEYRYTEADMETSLQGAAERELQYLWNNMGALNTIARVATLMGLLGTVVGMVIGFEELSGAEGVSKEKLAAAIGVALTTTVGGLCVAIPAIIGESALKAKIRHLMIDFEEILIEVIKASKIGKVTKETAAASLPSIAASKDSAQPSQSSPKDQPDSQSTPAPEKSEQAAVNREAD